MNDPFSLWFFVPGKPSAGRTEMEHERNTYFSQIAAKIAEVINSLITCIFIFIKSIPGMTLTYSPTYTQTLYLIHRQSRVSKSVTSFLSYLSFQTVVIKF